MVNLISSLLFLAICCTSSCAFSSVFPKVNKKLSKFDQNISERTANFGSISPSQHDLNWVREKVHFMRELLTTVDAETADVSMDDFTAEEKLAFEIEFDSRKTVIEANISKDITNLLETYKWFWISKFGAETDQEVFEIAMALNSDFELQTLVLGRLNLSYSQQESSGDHIAMLSDQLVIEQSADDNRKLQQFGTQGMCVGFRRWLPWPVEDESCLDLRRGRLGLKTESDYISSMDFFCN